ncbi:MAG: helix-turn-helix domain-containing protein, partial [Pseudomonadota bacterium]
MLHSYDFHGTIILDGNRVPLYRHTSAIGGKRVNADLNDNNDAAARADDARGVPGAQALGKAFALLNMIAEAPKPLRFTELMNFTGVPRGTLHRLLQALQDERMIRLDPRDQTFRLGNRVFEMAHRVWNDFDLRGAAAG